MCENKCVFADVFVDDEDVFVDDEDVFVDDEDMLILE